MGVWLLWLSSASLTPFLAHTVSCTFPASMAGKLVPLARRHKQTERSSAWTGQDRASDTQSPWGSWGSRACPHSLGPPPPLSLHPPFCRPLSPSSLRRGRGGGGSRITEGSPALWCFLSASVPNFPQGRATFCPGDARAWWPRTAISGCAGLRARLGARLRRPPLGRNMRVSYQLEAEAARLGLCGH